MRRKGEKEESRKMIYCICVCIHVRVCVRNCMYACMYSKHVLCVYMR